MGILAAGTRQPGSVSFLDAGGERATFHSWFPVVNAASEAALTTKWATLMSALDALCLGVRVKDKYVDETTYTAVRPTNGAAREVALKVIFQDAGTGQTWISYIPTVDLALIEYIDNYGARDVVDLTTTEVAAVVAALDDFPPKNPYNYANNGAVVGAQLVRGFK